MNLRTFTAEASLCPSRNHDMTQSGLGSPLGNGSVRAAWFCQELTIDMITGTVDCADDFPGGGGGDGGGGGQSGTGETGFFPLPSRQTCLDACAIASAVCGLSCIAATAGSGVLPIGGLGLTKFGASVCGTLCGAAYAFCTRGC